MMPIRTNTILLAWCVALAMAASARTILVLAQPVSEFADTEVSTNIVLHASRTDTREFGIHIQLAGLFREKWDMVRVTRRGAGVPSEWVRCDVEYASFAIKLR